MATKKKVKYDPKKHIRPIHESRFCSFCDEGESDVHEFISQQIGPKRFAELEEAYENDGDTSLKDITMTILEAVASLHSTAQQRYEADPFTLGDGDFAPSKNFYDEHGELLGQIEEE